MITNPIALEFLPAALEIEQTPPLPASRYILWAIMLFLLLSIVWACFGQIDIVGVAQAKIVPSGRVKIVQSLEPGIVKAIHVVEGQRVNAGELLIELVNTKTQAALTRLSGERQAYAREKNRITDQLTALDTFQSPNAYFDNISLGSARKPTFGTVFSARTASSLNDHFASIAAIDEESNQNRDERSTKDRQIELLDAKIPLISERAESLKQLEQRSLHA